MLDRNQRCLPLCILTFPVSSLRGTGSCPFWLLRPRKLIDKSSHFFLAKATRYISRIMILTPPPNKIQTKHPQHTLAWCMQIKEAQRRLETGPFLVLQLAIVRYRTSVSVLDKCAELNMYGNHDFNSHICDNISARDVAEVNFS